MTKNQKIGSAPLKIVPLSEKTISVHEISKVNSLLTHRAFFDKCNSLDTPFDFEGHYAKLNSKYVSIEEYNKLTCKSSFEILHLNISSLNEHFDGLNNFLAQLILNVKVIGVTQHKIPYGKGPNRFLRGYNFFFNSSLTTHGGVGIFVSDDLQKPKIRKDLEKVNSFCESIFVELSLPNSKKYLIGCVYRHPNTSVNDFTEDFILPLLNKLAFENKKCLIMGDFNIDLLKSSNNTAISNYYQTMCSFYFAPFVLQPTRITNTSSTLIDNIFFNSLEHITTSGNFEYQISDHLIQFLILQDLSYSPIIKTKIIERDYRY